MVVDQGYIITVFVGRGEHSLFFVQFRLTKQKTDFLPTREGLCEAGPGTKNESISVHGSSWPAAAQLFERNAVVLVPIRQKSNAWSKVQYSR